MDSGSLQMWLWLGGLVIAIPLLAIGFGKLMKKMDE